MLDERMGPRFPNPHLRHPLDCSGHGVWGTLLGMAGMIRNFESLARTPLRTDALAVAEAAYAAIDARKAVARKLTIQDDTLTIDGRTYALAGRRIFFVGVGKCAIAVARAVEELFGERLTAGVALDVSSVDAHDLKKIEVFIGTHPLPSEVNLHATERIVEFLSGLCEDDLVLMLVSGGGSTLLCLHGAPMTCIDEGMLFEALTAAGAAIQDVNTVRKHISRARGGGLAAAAYPAEVISLIVSDIPGDDLAFVASGPTIRDDSTVADAKAVLGHYGITPPAGIEFLETPKDEKYFERVTNILFLASRDALDAMADEATRRGYLTTIVDRCFAGEARDIGRGALERLHTSTPKSAFLYAGESTITLGAHPAKGGRNQEAALSVLADIRPDELVLCFASDGRDNTEHAGAIADAETQEHARHAQLSSDDSLARHGTFDFFAATGDFLETGYTGSNVSDLIIALKS